MKTVILQTTYLVYSAVALFGINKVPNIEILADHLTLMVGGVIVSALLSDGYFFMKKGVWMYKISWLFLIGYVL